MAKRPWLKSIDDLIEWGKRMIEYDDEDVPDIGELINLFGEFDDWAEESADDERRIEAEMKTVLQKMADYFEAHCLYYHQDCKDVLKSYSQRKILAENRPVRWYWKIFER